MRAALCLIVAAFGIGALLGWKFNDKAGNFWPGICALSFSSGMAVDLWLSP